MTRLEKIVEYLESVTTSELVSIHNEYCNKVNYMDDHIYCMESFDEMEQGTPYEIARRVEGCKFSTNDDYFWYDGYGNLVSGNEPDDIYIREIAEYVDDNDDYLYNEGLKDIVLYETDDDDEE